MKELDFDELDRAVNSLMSDIPAGASPSKSDDDDTRTLTIPTVPSDDAATSTTDPVVATGTTAIATNQAASVEPAEPTSSTDQSSASDAATPTAQPITAPEPASTPAVPLATRRSGRFMDVVHPSSDMKNPQNTPSAAPSRHAATLQPIAATTPDAEPAADQPDEFDTLASTPEVTATEPEVTPVPSVDLSAALDQSHPATTTTSDWPDPLTAFNAEPPTSAATAIIDDASTPVSDPVATSDPVASATVSEVAPVAANEDEDGDDELFTIDESEPEDEPQPLVSPFLSNTNIQKRPLGGVVTPAVEPAGDVEEPGRVAPTVASDDGTVDNPDDQLPADPSSAVTPVPLPDELQSDLVALESDTTTAVAAEKPEPADEPTPEPAAKETPVVDAKTPAVAVEPATAAEISPATTGPTSIQPQYKESDSTGEQTNGSIYDTKGYHQPLSHPAKKKSGWLWIVWVLIILVIGAGGGAALYLLKII